MSLLDQTLPGEGGVNECNWWASHAVSGKQAATGLDPIELDAGNRGSHSREDLTLCRVGAAPELSTAESHDIDVIFDGVLHNFAEIARSVDVQAGSTTTAAELIRDAYAQFGEAVFGVARGSFAILVKDRRREVLYATRDPIGVHPLFYAHSPNGFCFSPSIDVLLRHSGVNGELSPAAIASQMASRWPHPEETYYARIKRVPQGHVARFSCSAVSYFRAWDPAPPDGDIQWVRDDEMERFDFLLDQAVNRCLDYGPSAIFLSGGLDSVSIAAIATDALSRRGAPGPLALSVAFPTQEEGEQIVQRRVAESLGLEHIFVPLDWAVGSRTLLETALEMTPSWPMPLLSPWMAAYAPLGLEGSRRGARVVMGGAGGDEWLTITPILAADLIGQLRLVELARFASSFLRSHKRPPLPVLRTVLWRFGAKPALLSALMRVGDRLAPHALRARQLRRVRAARPDWLAPGASLQHELDVRLEQTLESPSPGKGGFYLRAIRDAIEHPMVSTEMEGSFESGRRMGMRHFAPYWDADLVDFLYRTPPRLLIREGRSKGLVRGMLARRFPKLGFERQKKIGGTPVFQDELIGSGRKVWNEIGGARALEQLGIVDGPKLEKFMQGIFSGTLPKSRAWVIWQVLNLESWARPRV